MPILMTSYHSEVKMNYVKAYLKRHNLKPEELANQLEVSKSLIEKLACGAMKIRKVVRLAMERLEMN